MLVLRAGFLAAGCAVLFLSSSSFGQDETPAKQQPATQSVVEVVAEEVVEEVAEETPQPDNATDAVDSENALPGELQAYAEELAPDTTLDTDGVPIEGEIVASEMLVAESEGTYTIDGAVEPYYAPGVAGAVSCDTGLCAEAIYDDYTSVPAMGCGGCSGGGFGGYGGGAPGGGFLNRRLVRLGAIGGIVAIAVASPDGN